MGRIMKRKICACELLLLLTVLGPWSDELHAQSRQVKQYSIDEFLGTTNYTGASFSRTGEKLLVSSDHSGIFNAYAIPVDGGEPVQLTASTDEAIFAISYFPEDERFLYLSDEGGNELSHIYVRDEDGTVEDLTPGDRLKASFFGWSADDRSFFVATNERDRRFFDVYEYDTETYERELIYENEEGRNVAAISPDKRYFAVLKVNSNADRDIFLYDRKTKAMRLLTDFEGSVQNGAQNFWGDQAFSPDGEALYYTTDWDHEFTYLVRQDVETGEIEGLIKPDWDVSDLYFSKNGKYFVITVNNDASTEVFSFTTAKPKPCVF